LKLSEEIIAKVKDAADIVDVIGETVNLRRRGQNYLGLCPFHNEKTPSFTVSANKGIYKCFGCGKGGNVFTFLTDKFGMSFIEAIESLAAKYHVELPKDEQGTTPKDSKRSQIYDALKKTEALYNSLLKNKDGKIAYDYFKGRGFDDELIEKFRLGYSPDDWNFVTKTLSSSGISIDILEEAGVVIKSDKGNYFDRFRSRAIFPIHDFMGRVIGFGGRSLTDDKNSAKYINSPQTLVYDKSKVLFGIYEAKNSIRSKQYSILTEGYADVISLHAAGFTNSIASSGTSLTQDQLRELKRFAPKLYIAYDGDSAGQEAAERAGEMALQFNFEVFVVKIAEDDDPDSIIQKYGAEKFEQLIHNAIDFFDFKIFRLKSGFKSESAGEITAAVREMTKITASIPDEMKHDFYIRKISESFNLTFSQVELLYKEKEQIRKKTRADESNRNEQNQAVNKAADTIIDNDESKSLSIDDIYYEEKLVLSYALLGLNEFSDLMEHFEIGTETFATDVAKLIFKVIQDNSTNDDILGTIINSEYVPNEYKDIIITISIKDEVGSENWELKFGRTEFKANMKKVITDCLLKLEKRKVDESLIQVMNLMKKEPEEIEHLKRFQQLKEQAMKLNNSLMGIPN